MLGALSTSHVVGLTLVAAVFIAFALISAMVIPRWRPQFPGKAVRFYVVLCLVFFVGMLAAVEVFGAETKEKAKAAAGSVAATTSKGAAAHTVTVTATEFKFVLSQTRFTAGSYEFVLRNAGHIGHDLVVSGPGGTKASTPVIDPGKTARLDVALKAGAYELYCSVPGHKDSGMDVKIRVA